MANMSIKFKTFSIAVILTWSCTWLSFSSDQVQSSFLNTCFSTEHNQGENSTNKAQCQPVYLANQSWFAWLTGGSHSAYFHFLDLVELLHPRK